MKEYEQEIIRLHNFFVDWFTGSLPKTETEFTKGIGCLAPEEFHLISPRGVVDGHDDLMKSLWGAYGCNEDFQIDIRNCKLIHQDQSTAIMTYEEWQTTNMKTKTTARISTVVFRRKADASIEWLHVHETWMPGKDGSAAT